MEAFSAVLICRNEGNVIGKCLESLKGIDDIVVLDTGSIDRSVEIAKSYGANVIEVGDKFCYKPEQKDLDTFFLLFGFEPTFKLDKKYFHFADARNYALTFAKNDWCFQPDCDEVVEWDLPQVKQAIQNEDHLTYRFVFSWREDGTPGLEFTHCKFFRKSKIQWAKWVHEVPVGAAKPPRYVDFIYHKHYQEFKESRGNYLPALELSVVRNPEDERNLFYLGREYYFQGEHKKAIQFFERAVPKITWAPEKSQANTYVGDCYRAMGALDKAKTYYLAALQFCDTRREQWYALGELLFQKHPDEALKYYTAATAIPFCHGKHGYFNDMNLYGWRIPERLAACYGRIGDFEKSKKWWLESLKLEPPGYVYEAASNFYGELPQVDILIPTLDRPAGLKRLMDSIAKLHYPAHKLVVVVEEDSPRIGVPKRVKALYKQTDSEYVVYAANDTEFLPNSIIMAMIEMLEGKLDLLAFNTGELYPDKGNICEHFMVRRAFVEKRLDGEIFDTEFFHAGCDNFLWAKANRYGKCARSEYAIMKHDHFSRNGKLMDEISTLAYSELPRDRALLAQKLAQLEA